MSIAIVIRIAPARISESALLRIWRRILFLNGDHNYYDYDYGYGDDACCHYFTTTMAATANITATRVTVTTTSHNVKITAVGTTAGLINIRVNPIIIIIKYYEHYDYHGVCCDGSYEH